MVATLDAQSPGSYAGDIKALEAEIESVVYTRYVGAAIWAHSQTFIETERPCKYILGAEVHHVQAKWVATLNDGDAIATTPSEIAGRFVAYFSSIFGQQVYLGDASLMRSTLSSLPLVPRDLADDVSGEITIDEVDRAIASLNNGKAPGPLRSFSRSSARI